MSLVCLGINHTTAPVEVRERFAFAPHELRLALQEVRDLEAIDETVILSTCNRVEIYAKAKGPESAFSALSDYLARHFKLEKIDDVDFYHLVGEEAARHLFRVASGLDSMVLGETEIFGQVKKAYSESHQAGVTSRVLNKLFQHSFQIAKLVRTNTHITRGSTSVGSVAVDLAGKIFGDLSGCQVMIVGAGEMSRTTAKSLLSRGAHSIIVSNRSYDKALELAQEMDGRAVTFDQWESAIREVDIIITSTSAPHTIMHRDMIGGAMKKRRGRPLFLIDIAVPRDVDANVNDLDSVYLYDIDALQKIADDAREEREKQIAICDQVISEFIEERGIGVLQPESGLKPEKEKAPEFPGKPSKPLTNP